MSRPVHLLPIKGLCRRFSGDCSRGGGLEPAGVLSDVARTPWEAGRAPADVAGGARPPPGGAGALLLPVKVSVVRTCPPVQGHKIDPGPGRPHVPGSSKAPAPTPEPGCLEPVLHERDRHGEKDCKEEEPPLVATREGPSKATKDK